MTVTKRHLQMLKKLFAVSFITIIIIGCSSSKFKSFQRDKDPFNPEMNTKFSSFIWIKTEAPFSHSSAKFNIELHEINGSVFWELDTYYYAKSWLFVKRLNFVVDGKVFKFDSSPSPIRDVGYIFADRIREVNSFRVDKDFIDSLRKAKSIKVRLIGKQYYRDKDLTKEEVKNIAWFINHVSPAWKNKHILSSEIGKSSPVDRVTISPITYIVRKELYSQIRYRKVFNLILKEGFTQKVNTSHLEGVLTFKPQILKLEGEDSSYDYYLSDHEFKINSITDSKVRAGLAVSKVTNLVEQYYWISQDNVMERLVGGKVQNVLAQVNITKQEVKTSDRTIILDNVEYTLDTHCEAVGFKAYKSMLRRQLNMPFLQASTNNIFSENLALIEGINVLAFERDIAQEHRLKIQKSLDFRNEIMSKCMLYSKE